MYGFNELAVICYISCYNHINFHGCSCYYYMLLDYAFINTDN